MAVSPCAIVTVWEVTSKLYWSSSGLKPEMPTANSRRERSSLKVNWPAPLVVTVSSSPLPCMLTVTPESGLPLDADLAGDGRGPQVGSLEPNDLRFAPLPTVAADEVLPKATSSSSNPEISMV